MNGLSLIIRRIRDFQKQGILGEHVFYRGQRDNQGLVPRLLRGETKKKKRLSRIENNTFCDAWIMGATELLQTKSSWEALALFQHYGIPTRLLDWTASLPNALFFALERCMTCASKKNCDYPREECEGAPTIWILDPRKMHSKLHNAKPAGSMIAITIGVDQFQDYKDEFVARDWYRNKWRYKNGPVFMEIPWSHPRVRSQKGYFTFHPDERPLESLLNERCGLVKIVLGDSEQETILDEFKALGITEHDVYADLASLGRFLRRRESDS